MKIDNFGIDFWYFMSLECQNILLRRRKPNLHDLEAQSFAINRMLQIC